MRSAALLHIAATCALMAACGAIAERERSAAAFDPLAIASTREEPDPMLTHCPERGKVINEDTNAQCCWPGQSWSVLQWRCVGIPQCPSGLVVTGEDCDEPAASPDAPLTAQSKERRTLDTALDEARECVVRNDQECCLRALRGVKRTSRVVEILLSCYHQSGRRDAACELSRHHVDLRAARLYLDSACSDEALAATRTKECVYEPTSKLDLAPVIAAYKQSDLAEAVSLGFAIAVESELESDRERAMRLARKLERFASILDDLREHPDADPRLSIARLEELLLLDRMISGGHFASSIGTKLRGAYLDRAKVAWRNGDQERACQAAVKAYKLAPESFFETSIAASCERAGQELLAKGQQAALTDMEAARSFYRKVLTMVPEASSSYREAYVRLNARKARSGEGR